MATPVISVEGLGKAYRIGHQHPHHQNFREVLTEIMKTPIKRLRKLSEDWSDETDTFWAIRDVSFDVNRGEEGFRQQERSHLEVRTRAPREDHSGARRQHARKIPQTKTQTKRKS